MKNIVDVPDPSVWLHREYTRHLERMGVRRLPRIRSSIEDAQRRLTDYYAKHQDTKMMEATSRLMNEEQLVDLLRAGSQLGMGAQLSFLAEGMHSTFERIGGGEPYPILVAEQAAYDFNASAINTASGFLILVGNGVPYFINQCAKIFGNVTLDNTTCYGYVPRSSDERGAS